VNARPYVANPERLARAAVAETNRAPLFVIELPLDGEPRGRLHYDNPADRRQLVQSLHAHPGTRKALKALGLEVTA
jgi:hypothetical protein